MHALHVQARLGIMHASSSLDKQWRTQWVAWIGPGLPTNLAQNSITTLEKLAQMFSFVSAQAEDTANPRALQNNNAPERDRTGGPPASGCSALTSPATKVCWIGNTRNPI